MSIRARDSHETSTARPCVKRSLTRKPQQSVRRAPASKSIFQASQPLIRHHTLDELIDQDTLAVQSPPDHDSHLDSRRLIRPPRVAGRERKRTFRLKDALRIVRERGALPTISTTQRGSPGASSIGLIRHSLRRAGKLHRGVGSLPLATLRKSGAIRSSQEPRLTECVRSVAGRRPNRQARPLPLGTSGHPRLLWLCLTALPSSLSRSRD
jgi:hypothetical protein